MEYSEETRQFVLKFVASLSLCDHMGDVGGDVDKALKELGVGIDFDDWSELRKALHGMGVTTMFGTTVWCDEDETDE